jgi:hypothetical protein
MIPFEVLFSIGAIIFLLILWKIMNYIYEREQKKEKIKDNDKW